MEIIKQLSDEDFTLTLRITIDVLTEYLSKSEFDNTLKSFEWSEEQRTALLKWLKDTLLDAAVKPELNLNYEFLTPSKLALINAIVKDRKEDLLRLKLKEHNSRLGSLVHNFDWKLKWILGSSFSAQAKCPIALVDFVSTRTTNDVTTNENVTIEMNKEELANLIKALEAIHCPVN